MAVAKVQGATGNGATIVLNGCVAANALIYQCSFFRATTTGLPEAAPTDSNGTFTIAAGSTIPYTPGGGQDTGAGVFYQQNINSGTHTVTPQTNQDHQMALTEFSGLATSGMFVANSKSTAAVSDATGTITSQSTGSTVTAASAGDLACISYSRAASPGNAAIGLTDPVSGYTTLKLGNDDATTVAHQHAFQVLSAGGTQSATFNWTEHVGEQMFTGAAIATFVAATAAAFAPMMPAFIWGRSKLQLARPHVDANASVLNNYLLAAAIGVYTYAGSAAKTTATRLLAAATGVYNLTGAAALLAFGHKLLANAGAYALTGSAASILAARLLAATKGTFTLTGAAAATLYKRILLAGTGVFTLTGAAISIARTYVLGATRGIFSLSGQAASTIYSAASASVADWIVRLRRRRR